MLRLKILVSAVPLMAAAILARVELVPSQRPCIAIGTDTLQITSAPWHADLHVSFTDDPALATVRVAFTDRAETADFAVIDDAEEPMTQPTPQRPRPSSSGFPRIPPSARP
jgi:hypothetical protein